VRGARNGHTTALFADECQSFLDNVIAGLGQIGSWKDPRIGSQGRPGRSATARITNSPWTGRVVTDFSAQECRNFFRHAGYVRT